MADSSSFSSLFALVDNHLSKSNLQHQDCQPSTSGLGSFKLPALDCQPSTSGLGSFKLPTLNLQKGLSDTRIPPAGFSSSSMRFPLPSFSSSEGPINNDISKHMSYMLSPQRSEQKEDDVTGKLNISVSDCPINDVLAMQLSNMFKAREAKEEQRRQQEQMKVEESLLNQEANSCLIDLMPAIQIPGQIQPQHINTPSTSSSMESLVIPDASDSMDDDRQDNVDLEHSRPVSPKPITTDLSHMLTHKLGRCSEFGKVLCARYRPVAAPYFRMHVPTNHIKVFDFSTPSPDDIVMERLRRPSFYNNSAKTLTVFD